MTYTLRLEPCRLPSWNKFYAGTHWSERAELAHYYHAVVDEAVRNQPLPELSYPVQITFRVTQAGRQRDVENIPTKILTDGLVLAGVLPDDTPTYYDRYVVITRKGTADSVTIEIRGDEE